MTDSNITDQKKEKEDISAWIQQALALGFDEAVPMDSSKLTALPSVREMCAEDKCHAYNRNWTCPPACGTLEECEKKMRAFSHGILLQSVGHMTKTIDSRAYRETEQRHMKNFRAFSALLRERFPDALCLGAGGCRVCRSCAFPEPCRFPEQAYSSMEGYGLFVTQVCRDNNLPYYHGERTITYTACVLFG